MTNCINSTIFLSQILLTKIKNILLIVVCVLSSLIVVKASCLWPIILDRALYLCFLKQSFAILFDGYYGLQNVHINATLLKRL